MKDEYTPWGEEQTIAYLVEELGEAIAAAGKLLRWGEHSTNPELKPGDETYGETNGEWLLRELVDVEEAIKRTRYFIREVSND